MFKNSMLLALAALSLSPAVAVSAAAPTGNTQIQMPCKAPIAERVPACVVVYKTVVNRSAGPASQLFDLSSAAPLKGNVQSFSVVYVYRSANRGGDTITVERGNNMMMSDIEYQRPTYVWMTTRNGGKTWSRLTTNNMDSVITS